MLSPYPISDICCSSFISLNFAGLFSIAARISTQLSMTSHGENEALNVATFNMFIGHFVEFERCFFFFFKLTICTSNFGANRIKHVSEMELYTILSTLDKFECWNLTGLITK